MGKHTALAHALCALASLAPYSAQAEVHARYGVGLSGHISDSHEHAKTSGLGFHQHAGVGWEPLKSWQLELGLGLEMGGSAVRGSDDPARDGSSYFYIWHPQLLSKHQIGRTLISYGPGLFYDLGESHLGPTLNFEIGGLQQYQITPPDKKKVQEGVVGGTIWIAGSPHLFGGGWAVLAGTRLFVGK